MALGRDVVHVVKSCIELEADMLGEVDVPEFAESSDAEYYRKLVERVIAAFHISRDNIIGISVDNTAVNPSFVRLLGLQLLPCVMHVGNLI